MLQLPKTIKKYIADESYQSDCIGMSDSSVLLFDDKVLKVQKRSKDAENEYRMLLWLDGKLSVPKVYAYEVEDDMSYLLMGKCEGKMSCDEMYMLNPDLQAEMLAKGMRELWEVDIKDCPCDWSLKAKLEEARYYVEHDMVDVENTEPGTFGKNGFKDPDALLSWLYDNQPEEELALSHGDFCLPNILFHDKTVQYIDLGKTGIADKWCDIAICYRSISHNYDGKYGGPSYAQPDDMLLFRKLGIAPNWEKIRYYILLDELF